MYYWLLSSSINSTVLFPRVLPLCTSSLIELTTRSAWLFLRNWSAVGFSFTPPLWRCRPKNFSSGSGSKTNDTDLRMGNRTQNNVLTYLYLYNVFKFLLKPVIYPHPCTMNEQNLFSVAVLLVHRGNHEAYWPHIFGAIQYKLWRR